MKAVSSIGGKGRFRFGGLVLCGVAGFGLLGWTALARPVPAALDSARAEEEPVEAPAFERKVFVVYSVNNLGYTDTCG